MECLIQDEAMLFGKWSYLDLPEEMSKDQPPDSSNERACNTFALCDYITAKGEKAGCYVPHTAGRHGRKPFAKAKCQLVERLVNALMFHGRNTGKKAMAIRIVKHAMDIIHILTDENPIKVLIDAVETSAPREDALNLGAITKNVIRHLAIDLSPMRRVNLGLLFIARGTRTSALRNCKTVAECLADEIMNAAKGSSNSYAIRKKDEMERLAKASR